MYEVLVVGAGPAGLNAALVLGRCRRRVLICDTGRPRNAASGGVHGFLTQDGIHPEELRRLGLEQLAPYDTVEFRRAAVIDARCGDRRFEATLEDGSRVDTRMLLLATGVVDEVPKLEGIRELYGRSVFHCPFCDGWEVRDQPLAHYNPRASGVDATLKLTVWSRDLVLCTDGPAKLADKDRQRLARREIRVFEGRIARLEGADGRLERIVFADGSILPRRAMFFSTGFRQHSDLAERLNCAFREQPVVDTGRYLTTNIPGLFVAGDAAREMQSAIVAAAEGAKAAFAINEALVEADLGPDD